MKIVLSLEFLQDLLNAISQCLSIVTGKRCRASLKELESNLIIKTIARDKISKINKHLAKKNNDEFEHNLDDNTDFYKLWYSIDGYSRYYISNDIISDFKEHNYKNSSLKIYGEPEFFNIFGIKIIKKWTLPYKSTIVFPTRYISEFIPPMNEKNSSGIYKENPKWTYWGFLCIDNISRNTFDILPIPELGAGFADIFYVLFNEIKRNGVNKAKVNE